MPGSTITRSQEDEYWTRHARSEPWAGTCWFPPVAGHPSRSGTVDPDEPGRALPGLNVPDRRVPASHPWPDRAAAGQAVSGGKLAEIKAADLFRVTVTVQARDALTRDNTGWTDPEPPGTVLRTEADHACKYAVTSGFNTCLREGFRRYTALTVNGMPSRPGTPRQRDVVITLRKQVRSMALGSPPTNRHGGKRKFP